MSDLIILGASLLLLLGYAAYRRKLKAKEAEADAAYIRRNYANGEVFNHTWQDVSAKIEKNFRIGGSK